jgi:integrase
MSRPKGPAKLPKNIIRRPGREGYYIRIMLDGQRIVRGAYSTLDAAQIALGTLRKEAERSDLGLPKRSAMTLQDFAHRCYLPWAKLHKRESSWRRDVRTLRARILPALGALRLSDVNRQRVNAYLRDRLSDVKPATANREAALLRHMMTRAVDEGLLDASPLKGLKLFPESTERSPALSREDEARLLDASQPWLAEVVRAALLTGARQGELLALRWRHVAFDQGLLIVEDSKSGSPRMVPMHPDLAEALRARRGLPEGYLFTLPNGEPLKRHTVSQAFRRACARLGLPLRFHDLRHVAATRMLSSGAGMLQIAAILGHKTLHMVRRYSHVQMADMRAAVEMLPSPNANR